MSRNPFAPVLDGLRRLFGLDPVARSANALLLARYAESGDEAAFAALVERHAAMVWGVCLRVTRDQHAAEDAFQATWIVLAKKASSLKDGASLPGWLHRVAFRLAVAARPKAATAPLEDVPSAAANSPEEAAALRETREAIDEEVNRLPEKYRLPVVLCFYEGRTHAEAAAELGWPVGTVAGRVARVKDLLHARLARRGVGPALALTALVAAGGAAPVVGGSTEAATLAAGLLSGDARRRSLAWAAGLLGALALLAILLFALFQPEAEDRGFAVWLRFSIPDVVGTPALSRDGKLVASGAKGGLVKLWDAQTGVEKAILEAFTGGEEVGCITFNADGTALAFGGSAGMVAVCDIRPGSTSRLMRWHDRPVVSVAFALDGRVVVSQGESGSTINVSSVSNGKEYVVLKGASASFAASPDGKTLAFSSRINDQVQEAVIRLWDIEARKELTSAVVGLEVRRLAFSPDGKTLASGGADGSIKLWRMRAGD